MMTIDKANAADISELAERITPADAAELKAAGTTVADCLAGVGSKALRWNGRLVALFGVVSHHEAPTGGIPWMLCTDTLATVPRRAMADVSRRVVDEWQGCFDYLTNLIHRHNTQALRFVRWLGFTVHADTPTGPGQDFYIFEWRRNV